MTVNILRSGHPTLRKVAKPVARIDKKIKGIIKDLKETLAVQKNPEGVGLAAPQIGKSLRIFVMSHRGVERVVINPEILTIRQKVRNYKPPKEEKNLMEGCLSLPDYYGPLKRAQKVRIRYLNEEGKRAEEDFKGFLAQIILHEIDHLNGVLFVDRLLEQKKSLYKLEEDGWEEVEIT